jgi:hypothetical protein
MKNDILISCRCAATLLVFGALLSRESFAIRAIASAAAIGIRSFLN